MEPLISVIVPVYKVEKYLDKCVQSIIGQTYRNLEIWLVDDGSTDKCPLMCDAYAQMDSRIKVIHKTNGGLSDARNVAINVATGDYILFVDSDDYIEQNHVATLYEGLVKNNADIAINTACFFFENEIPTPAHSERKCLSTGRLAVKSMFYQELYDTTAWGKLYKRTLFESGIRYPKGLLFEDLPTTYRLLLNADRVYFEDIQSYFYLMRNDSIEGSAISEEKIYSAKCIIEQLLTDRELETIKDAVFCRVFSFALHVMLQMKVGHPDYDYFKTIVRKYRVQVLKNGDARKKARVAALISFLGMGMVRFVFNRTKKR